MKFITVPENYAPLDEGLVYDIDLEGLTESADVSVINAEDDTAVATLRFAQTAFISLDIAPYVQRMFDPRPADGPAGISIDRGRTVTVVVAVAGKRTPERRFTMLHVGSRPRLLTTMPARRTISAGESDEVAIYAPDGGRLTVNTASDSGTESQTIELAADSSIRRLNIATRELPADFNTIDVVFEAGEWTERLHYDRVLRPRNAVRLAWTAASGAIERYTFHVRRTTKSVAKESFCNRDGHRTASVACRKSALAVSDYEPAATIEALEEILSARRVWRTDGERAEMVEVVSTETILRFDGELNALTIEIGDAREGGEVRL